MPLMVVKIAVAIRSSSTTGAAAGVAGLAQQLTGALGGWMVGWVRHDGPVNLGLLMMGFTLCAIAAQAVLHRPRGRA